MEITNDSLVDELYDWTQGGKKVDEYEGDDDETLEWEGDRFYNV